MKLIKPKAKYLPQASGLEGVYKQIELAGRTCYRSEDKITEGSTKPFVDRMIASRHLSMLEHGTVYLRIPRDVPSRNIRGKYSKHWLTSTDYLLTTNLRRLVEKERLDLLQYICDPTEFHEKRYTFRLTTSIGVTREIIRHRHFSFAEQSTRYCNFSKDKFDNEITFCISSWMNIEDNSHFSYDEDINSWQSSEDAITSNFLQSIAFAEKNYLTQIKNGWQPQQAREVLPLSTASEIVVTGFSSDFRHFFDLRLFGKTGKAHPNMVQLAELMKEEAQKAGIWDDIISKPSKFN